MNVIDTDARFVIDPVSGEITNQSSKETIAKGSHNSEVFTFEMPRDIGHDPIECNLIEIHYININVKNKTEKSEGIYKVKDITVCPEDENKVILSWLIDGSATVYRGILSFSIHFKCIDGNGKCLYRLPTKTYSKITVTDAVDVSGAVIEEHQDIIAEWEARISALEESGGGSAEGAVLYTEQDLTDEQKAQARKNIDALSVDPETHSDEFFAICSGMPSIVSGQLARAGSYATTDQTRSGTNPIGIVCKKGVTYKLSRTSTNYQFAYHIYKITSPPSDFIFPMGLSTHTYFPEVTGKMLDSGWNAATDVYYTAEEDDILLAPVFNYGNKAMSKEYLDEILNTFSITWEEDVAFVKREMGEDKASRSLVTNNDGDVVTSSTVAFEESAKVNPLIKSVNHRGYGTAPENTLSAFRLSKEKGFDIVECDVNFTADGVAVLLHDDTIDRTSNGTGTISELTFEYVRSLDFGSWKSADYTGEKIPTFEEFIALCRQLGLHPYIELKTGTAYTQENVNTLVSIVKKYGMLNNVTWISSTNASLNYVKTAHASARLGLVRWSVTATNLPSSGLLNLKNDSNEVFLDADASTLADDAVTWCIENNMPIEVFGVNTADAVISANPYISGFTTDTVVAGVTLYNAK